MVDQPWAEFVERARPHLVLAGYTLCLDPGETTGWALFEGTGLRAWGQWPTPEPSDLVDSIYALPMFDNSEDPMLERIVYEEYRVRGNKYKEHVGSEVVTIQHIGAIKVVASELAMPLFKQSAGMAKGFATDAKLRRWGLYQTGLRHANDAIRHGCYWILFASSRKPVGRRGREQEEAEAEAELGKA